MKNQVLFDYILADTWFGAKDNMEYVHYDLKKLFIFGIKINRLIAFSQEEKKRGEDHKFDSEMFQDGEKREIWLKDLAFSVVLVKKIFKNEDGSTGVLRIVTNDLNSDANQIMQVYQKRWQVEVYHKSIKQNASLAKSPTKVVRSQKNHIFSSIIAYCKLEMLKFKTYLNHFALKYKLIVRANQMAFQELKILRQNI